MPITVRRVAPAIALCLTLASAGTSWAQQLNKAVNRALADARLGEARVGVVVKDLRTGATLAAVNADGAPGESGPEPFIPASNMKLLTSGAAIAMLGPDFAFETQLLLDADRLIVRGAGDPAFADPELLEDMGLGVNEFIDLWKDAVLQAVPADGEGRRPSIREVVIDARIFDAEAVHPSWPADQLNRWYCAEVHGFNFHANVLSVYPTPTELGRAPRLRTEPSATWLEIENQARTVDKGGNTGWISRAPGGNALRMHGNIRYPAQEAIEVALTSMPLVFGRLLADRLETAGFGRAEVRLASAEDSPAQGRVIATVRTPLAVVLERCNTDSHNLYAEALLKRIGFELTGQPGSWSTGAAALRMMIQERLGPRFASSVEIADGSGMSRLNRVTPAMLAAWIESIVKDERLRPAFAQSLPVASESGTLRKRFRENRVAHEVRAKTGYLNGVSSLSGYITDESGEPRVAFSIIVNGARGGLPMPRVKDLQEKVVVIADDWLAPEPAVQPGG